METKIATTILEQGNALISQPYLYWIILGQFTLNILLVHLLLRKKEKKMFSEFETAIIKDSKRQETTMDNLMKSIHKSGGLFKELSQKCHPDRFINDPRQKAAEMLFQEITENRRNYEKLTALKAKAIEELNLKF